MFDAFVAVLKYPTIEGSFVDHFADILVEELAGPEIRVGPEAKSFFPRFDDGYAGVLILLKPPVLAILPAVAINALRLCNAVDALGILSARLIPVVTYTRPR